MAKPVYVEVAHFTVKETFDPKYKSTLPKVMTDSATAALKAFSSKVTLKKPADKNETGYTLGGAIAIKKTAKGSEGKIKMQLNHWPQDSLYAMAEGGASAEGAATVEEMVDSLVDDLVRRKIISAI